VPLVESVAEIDNETLAPSVLVWSVGVVIVTGLLTVQVKLWLTLYVPSAAVTVTY